MKKVLSIGLLAVSLSGFSQIYVGEKCKITFFSETKLENIDATNSVQNLYLKQKQVTL